MATRAFSRRFRAVALDMDGTLLSSLQTLTPRTVAALHRVEAAGIKVIIATGRPAAALQPFIEQLALPKPVPTVCFNGASAMMLAPVSHGGEPQVLLTQGLSRDSASQILDICEKHDWCASYCHSAGAAAAPRNAGQEERLQNFERLEGIGQERVASLHTLVESSEPPLKLVAMVDNPEACAEKARDAIDKGSAHVIAAEMHIEFLNPVVCKGHTLAKLCTEHLGIGLEDVIAFGDNHNDSEMLQLVGHGVAMKNAKDALKAVSARVCRWTNDEEGVAQELELLLDE